MSNKTHTHTHSCYYFERILQNLSKPLCLRFSFRLTAVLCFADERWHFKPINHGCRLIKGHLCCSYSNHKIFYLKKGSNLSYITYRVFFVIVYSLWDFFCSSQIHTWGSSQTLIHIHQWCQPSQSAFVFRALFTLHSTHCFPLPLIYGLRGAEWNPQHAISS